MNKKLYESHHIYVISELSILQKTSRSQLVLKAHNCQCHSLCQKAEKPCWQEQFKVKRGLTGRKLRTWQSKNWKSVELQSAALMTKLHWFLSPFEYILNLYVALKGSCLFTWAGYLKFLRCCITLIWLKVKCEPANPPLLQYKCVCVCVCVCVCACLCLRREAAA